MWELKGGKKQIFIKDMSEISLYIDSHLVGKRAKHIFSRRMWIVFGFGLNHTSESSVRAKYTIYLPSFLATIHYYVAFPLVDILFITKERYLFPKYRVTNIWAERLRYGYTRGYALFFHFILLSWNRDMKENI